MKIAAAVILYNPDEQVIDRINSYSSFVDLLIILDNTEQSVVKPEMQQRLQQLKNSIYIHDGDNKGISIRLNQAVSIAIDNNYHWLLTMDQDSYFATSTIQAYLQCVKLSEEKPNAAMYGVQYENGNTDLHQCSSEEVEFLITSGSILNLAICKSIGGFDEALFIDKVDHEYCLRAKLSAKKIIRFNNIYLHHSPGKITYGRSFKNLKKTPRTIHSPLRMYYIYRNYFYLKSVYKGQFSASFKEMRKELFLRTKNNLLYGENRLQLVKYLFRAYKDFKAGKMGKIN